MKNAKFPRFWNGCREVKSMGKMSKESEEDKVMHIRLTLQEKLRDLREERGLKLEELSKQIGISKSALSQYENDEGKEIGHKHICMLAKFYNVSADYLVGLSENRNPVNAEVRDLHLQDKTIELLTSGKLNNRLICEMIEHEDFPKFLVDTEAYVDRWAEMELGIINRLLMQIRAEISEQYGTILSKEDLEKQMEAFQIQEEEFFAQKVADSIFGIVHGIREAHFDDNTTAPRINIQHLIGGIESYMNLVAEPNVDDMFESICEDYGINPDALSYQQIDAFKEVLKKSMFLTKGRRGKNG